MLKMTDLYLIQKRFIEVCLNDDITTARKLVTEINIDNCYDYIMQCCCERGNMKVFEWLFSNRKIHRRINEWFLLASINNKTNIMHFLYSTPEKTKIDNKYALELSCENRSYEAIKLICQFNPDFSLCKH